MTRVLMSSFRKDRAKYKLYREREEADLWTVITAERVLFQGTEDELVAFCDGAGFEFERVKDENWTAAAVPTEEVKEAVEVVEGDSEEDAESIPEGEIKITMKEATTILETEDSVSIETFDETPTVESVQTGVLLSKDGVGVEEAVEAESEPPDALADLDAEIAALKAKREEMKK